MRYNANTLYSSASCVSIMHTNDHNDAGHSLWSDLLGNTDSLYASHHTVWKPKTLPIFGCVDSPASVDSPLPDSVLPSRGDFFFGPCLSAANFHSPPPIPSILEAEVLVLPGSLEDILAAEDVAPETRSSSNVTPCPGSSGYTTLLYTSSLPKSQQGPRNSPILSPSQPLCEGGALSYVGSSAPWTVPPSLNPSFSNASCPAVQGNSRVNHGVIPRGTASRVNSTTRTPFPNHKVSPYPTYNASPYANTQATSPEPLSETPHRCQWREIDGSICGGNITRKTTSEHLVVHGIVKKASNIPIICRWCPDGREPMKRESIVRHVREAHLGVKRTSN
ncbi:hypothetical protein BS17DRAFT_186348 [Gyrodon lividus]|nr:hypothetical protein BS17DRAFT_186348 [Gyrodon lividus]